MSTTITVAPRSEFSTFMGFSLCTELDTLEADLAVLGIPYGDPYNMGEVTNDQSNAPAAVRRKSARLSSGLDHWDFDLGGPLFDGLISAWSIAVTCRRTLPI